MSLQMSFLVMSIAFFLLLGIVRGEADFSDGITKRNMQSVNRSDVAIYIYDCGYLGDVLPGWMDMCFYIFDADGNFTSYNSPSIDEVYNGPIEKDNEIDETSLTAYNNIGMVLDFLWNEWGRDSWDGMGSSVTGAVNFGPESGPTAINDASNSANIAAMYFPPDMWPIPTNLMAFGNNRVDGMAWSTSLDVVAHEFSHGMFWADVVDYLEFPLPPEWSPFLVDEPLAVDEHFCDVLAALLDKYVGKDDEAVYSIFEDLYPVGEPLRLMSNPAALSDTDWYSEKLVRPEDEDPDYQLNKNGYPHQTAGVANLAFYLLSEGGVHPNATKAGWTGITVQGIGIENAGRIWNDARSDCLSIGALFTDVRACTELKAPDEFKNSVRQAWDAVGVPDSVGVGVGMEPLITGGLDGSETSKDSNESDVVSDADVVVASMEDSSAGAGTCAGTFVITFGIITAAAAAAAVGSFVALL